MKQYKWVYGVTGDNTLVEYDSVDALIASGNQYEEIRAMDETGRLIDIATLEKRTIQHDEAHKTEQIIYEFNDGHVIVLHSTDYRLDTFNLTTNGEYVTSNAVFGVVEWKLFDTPQTYLASAWVLADAPPTPDQRVEKRPHGFTGLGAIRF